jgi:glucose/mannose-6-phosphate isomerase
LGENLPKSILDDIEGMRKIDKSNMLSFCLNAADNYRESAEKTKKIQFDFVTPENIIVAGMGGSAIGGELLKDYTRATAKVPVEISREYHLPAYAGKKSLVILASYSGDTEETLSSLLDAVKRKCMIFCVGSGGNLIKYSKKLNLPHLQVKGGMAPRAALPHMVLPLLACLEKINIGPKFSDDISEATRLLEKVSGENAPERPIAKSVAKTLAQNLSDPAPVVYGFGIYRGVALRFKQQFNENAKVPSKWETFSELNHNETMGWENAKELCKCFALVLLRDKSEPEEILSRIETTKKLMEPNLSKMFEVWAQGKSDLAKMLSTILVGDFTSVYLAMLRGVDPTPVNTVNLMKEKIEQNGVKEKILRELEKISAK